MINRVILIVMDSVGVGKIGDLFGHRGLSAEIHTQNNEDGVDRTLESMGN
jgi:phosphopentomutase